MLKPDKDFVHFLSCPVNLGDAELQGDRFISLVEIILKRSAFRLKDGYC